MREIQSFNRLLKASSPALSEDTRYTIGAEVEKKLPLNMSCSNLAPGYWAARVLAVLYCISAILTEKGQRQAHQQGFSQHLKTNL